LLKNFAANSISTTPGKAARRKAHPMHLGVLLATFGVFSLRHSSSSSVFVQRASASSAQWPAHWAAIEEMRTSGAGVASPVDTMGAEALAISGAGSYRQGKAFRFQTLVSCMLSPQTKDAQTAAAFRNLVELCKPLDMTSDALARFTEEDVQERIKMTSFYKVKAKNLLNAAHLCNDKYEGDLPLRIEQLLEFPGVGPKVGFLTFSIARGEDHGICVDTHVHRIANRLGWVNTIQAKSNGPEKSRKALELILPKEKWGAVNGLLVGFGQSICEAKRPKCNLCLLAKEGSGCLHYGALNASSSSSS